MNAYTIKLSNGRNTFLGKLIIADNALYFLCSSKGNALLESAGRSIGGLSGYVIKALADPSTSGELPSEINETELVNFASQLPNSIVFEANKIEKIQDTWLVKMIKWDGKKIGVPSGFSKSLKAELIPWSLKHGIATKGL
ncbi:MAG: hypothetical protein IPP32_03305 [Bacteroidetes bacterium]|nr:hypothetical protein [Bacteroidota bacterium]